MLRRIQKIFTDAARSKQFIEGAKFDSQPLNRIPFTNDLNKVQNMIAYRTYFIQHSPFSRKNFQYQAEIPNLHFEKNMLTFKQIWRRRIIAMVVGLSIIFVWEFGFGIGFNADWGANYNLHRRRKIFGNLRNGAREGGDADD